MKIVSLLGSPRSKGNSAAIAARFAETAAALGAEVRTFELNRLTYRGCQACYGCKKKHDHCVVEDDLTEVLEAIREAGALVLATPVYFGDVTGQLKSFFDRTFSFLVPDYRNSTNPSRLSPKKFLFILTQGAPDGERFDDIYSRYSGFLQWLGFLDSRLIRAVGVGPGNPEPLPAAILEQAEVAARAIVGRK